MSDDNQGSPTGIRLKTAVRRESEQTIAHWWGIDPQTVTKWRTALKVGIAKEGTSQLFHDYSHEPWAIEARAKAHSNLNSEYYEKRSAHPWKDGKRIWPRPMIPTRAVLPAIRFASWV